MTDKPTATIALTEDELEILMQALNARDVQLRYHVADIDPRRVALPTLQAIKAKTGDALTALWANRRQRDALKDWTNDRLSRPS